MSKKTSIRKRTPGSLHPVIIQRTYEYELWSKSFRCKGSAPTLKDARRLKDSNMAYGYYDHWNITRTITTKICAG